MDSRRLKDGPKNLRHFQNKMWIKFNLNLYLNTWIHLIKSYHKH